MKLGFREKERRCKILRRGSVSLKRLFYGGSETRFNIILWRFLP